MDDHYATLQVAATASPAVIRAAYRVLTQQYHPDKNPEEPTADAILQRLNAAYTVLSDPVKRRAYDVHRRAAPEPAAPDRPEPAADPTSRPDLPEAAFTGTVKGHTFTLRWYSARVIANTVWTETTTTVGRDGVTTAATPRQQLGFRPNAGPDCFIEAAGHPLPVALDQTVVLIATEGGRLQHTAWVAFWNRNTGHWYWLGHTQESIGKAIRTDAAAVRDTLRFVWRVLVSVVLIGALLYRSGHWLAWLPLGVLGGAVLLGWHTPRRTRTAGAIGWALRRHIATLVAHLESQRDA